MFFRWVFEYKWKGESELGMNMMMHLLDLSFPLSPLPASPRHSIPEACSLTSFQSSKLKGCFAAAAISFSCLCACDDVKFGQKRRFLAHLLWKSAGADPPVN